MQEGYGLLIINESSKKESLNLSVNYLKEVNDHSDYGNVLAHSFENETEGAANYLYFKEVGTSKDNLAVIEPGAESYYYNYNSISSWKVYAPRRQSQVFDEHMDYALRKSRYYTNIQGLYVRNDEVSSNTPASIYTENVVNDIFNDIDSVEIKLDQRFRKVTKKDILCPLTRDFFYLVTGVNSTPTDTPHTVINEAYTDKLFKDLNLDNAIQCDGTIIKFNGN